jgi:small-conductance mechanosensitive channel
MKSNHVFKHKFFIAFVWLIVCFLFCFQPVLGTETEDVSGTTDNQRSSHSNNVHPDVTIQPEYDVTPTPSPRVEPSFILAENMADAMRREAITVRETLEETASRFFIPEPLGFSIETFSDLYQDIILLPMKAPVLMEYVVEQARLLGFIGSMVLILFLSGLTYMIVGQRRVLKYLESLLVPLLATVPETFHPYLKLLLKLVAAILFPGVFWLLYWFVQSFTGLHQPWFILIGRLMVVWAGAVAALVLLKALFHDRLIQVPEKYGITIYRVTRFITLYIVLTIFVFYSAEAFQINPEYLAVLKVVINLSIVLVSVALLVKKQAILSLLPDLPYKGYQVFRSILTRVYAPAMIGTFLTGVLWSFGYRDLCRYIWTKTWAVAMVIVVIVLTYHFLNKWITAKRKKHPKSDEAADNFYSALSAALIFVTVTALLYFVFSLLGIFEPLQRLISFPIFYVGETAFTLWVVIRAFLVIYIVLQLSKILRSYLDFKIFPTLGVEEGLAYSINTFIGYSMVITGGLFALYSTGFDFRILMVFAGAIGIGVGLGLQNFAANVISGFMLIFGRKVRKGDWIETSDTLGYVREVSLRATKVVTRDNIEYIIPNTELTSKIIVNYSLMDPLIRIIIPVGVSYLANPEEVRMLLMKEADKSKEISRERAPSVLFTDYADSSINFALLVWIDIRRTSERIVKSELYFRIFKALAEAGIEIPFPQRDIHIRSDLTKDTQQND